MDIEHSNGTTHLTVDGGERRAIHGSVRWIVMGPFARRYELWARSGWTLELAKDVHHRFSRKAIGESGTVALDRSELALLLAMLDTALDGPWPIPDNDWECLTYTTEEEARRVADALRADAGG